MSDAKRLKALEDENAKLKKLLAEAMLDNADAEGSRLKKMVTPAARREAVAHLRVTYEVSERRACSALGADRTIGPLPAAAGRTMRRCARGCASWPPCRRRFGYRRLHVLLRREGIAMNHKKLRRLYREERLQVRRRGGRKRALGTRAPMAIPQGANQRWSPGLRSDAAGRRPPLPHPGDRRRLHPGVPGAASPTPRCLAAGRARARCRSSPRAAGPP